MTREEALATLAGMGVRLMADAASNNHCTAYPQFTVQRLKRVYGFDPDYVTGVTWLDSESEAREVSERRAATLNRRWNSTGYTVPDRYIRTGYVDEWEFVDAYVTPEAARERVDALNQRDGKGMYRVYVESGYRNREWQALREALMTLARHAAAPSESQTHAELASA